MANTNAIWQQAAHATYKLSPPWNFNNNKSISEEQNLVQGDHSKWIHKGACAHEYAYTIDNLQTT